MQYAERLPTTKTLLAPVLALAVGAAAATGAYAVLDSETMVVGKPEVIVAEVPAPGTVAETKNEATIAAGIAAGASGTGAETKNEAAIAAGIAAGAAGTGAETKNEAAIAAGISAGTAEDALARGNDLKAPGARTN